MRTYQKICILIRLTPVYFIESVSCLLEHQDIDCLILSRPNDVIVDGPELIVFALVLKTYILWCKILEHVMGYEHYEIIKKYKKYVKCLTFLHIKLATFILGLFSKIFRFI